MNLYYVYTLDLRTSILAAGLTHHNNFGNFYTREIYAIAIPIGFIPIPIVSRMAIPIPMGFPWEWDSHGVSHSHAHLYSAVA